MRSCRGWQTKDLYKAQRTDQTAANQDWIFRSAQQPVFFICHAKPKLPRKVFLMFMSDPAGSRSILKFGCKPFGLLRKMILNTFPPSPNRANMIRSG